MFYLLLCFVVGTVSIVDLSTRSPQAACCPRRIVILPAQTYEIIESGLILSVAKPRCDVEGMLKI